MFKRVMLILAGSGFVASSAAAHEVPQTHFLETAKPYASYAFLIGDWYSKPAGEDMIIHQQFAWGPGNGSISYATYIDQQGKPEHLHFGGLMVWNGKSHTLDYLFAVEPGSGVQERGTFAVQADGSVVREVEATYPDGKVARNRQLFRRGTDGTLTTDLQQETAKGWVSVLPGGPLTMTATVPG
jgi:hypothetical protein